MEKKKGRPKSLNPRCKRVSVRVTDEEHDMVLDLSKRFDMSISDLIISYIRWLHDQK